MMLKALVPTFDMYERLYTFALYYTPVNVTRSTGRLYSPKYVPRDLSTYSNPESSNWDMKLPYSSSFASDIQWRLDPHRGFWISHVVS